jgi:hypothetical protein
MPNLSMELKLNKTTEKRDVSIAFFISDSLPPSISYHIVHHLLVDTEEIRKHYPGTMLELGDWSKKKK